MKTFYCSLAFLLCLALCGCTSNCSVGCGGNIYLVAVGYTKSQLDSMVQIVQNPNGTKFTVYVSSAYWSYPSPNDTASDTLIYNIFKLNNGIAGTSCDLVIRGTTDTYKISDVVLGGDISESQSCSGGTPSPGYCSSYPYLMSYVLNGTNVSVPPPSSLGDTTGYIYISK